MQQHRNWLTSSQLFTFAGFSLVVLAFVTFTLKIPIQAQPMDVDYFRLGWLFAPIIGVWGLACTVLGLVQSSEPKRKIESVLLPIFTVVCVGLTYAAYMVLVYGLGIIRSVGRGEPFWWMYFVLILVPSLIAITSTITYLRGKEKNSAKLKSKKVKIAMFAAMLSVPLVYSAALLAYLGVF